MVRRNIFKRIDAPDKLTMTGIRLGGKELEPEKNAGNLK